MRGIDMKVVLRGIALGIPILFLLLLLMVPESPTPAQFGMESVPGELIVGFQPGRCPRPARP